MKTHSFGPVRNEDGSPSETTKAFARDNPFYVFAEIVVPANVPFPLDMLRDDNCEICPSHRDVLIHDTKERRFMVRREKLTLPRSPKGLWTKERWESFGVVIHVLSGESR